MGDANQVLLVAIATGLGVLCTILMLRRSGVGTLVGVGRKPWSDAVRTVAGELGIAHTHLPEAFDMAHGDIGRTRLDIGYDTIDHYDGLVMKIEVSAGSLPETLVIRRPGARLQDESVVGTPQSSGDASFDARVEIVGAPSIVLEAIAREPELRGLISKTVAEFGATIANGNVLLLDRTFCQEAPALRERVHAMLDLARRLENPTAKVAPIARATAGTVTIRRAKAMDSEPRIEALREFFQSIAPALGQASVYRKPGEDELDIRATYRGRPVRLEIDSSLGIEITVRTSNAPGMLFFNFSPELRASDEAAPAWGGGDASRKHFVGEQVYLEGGKRVLEEKLHAFESMTPHVRRAIADQMPALGIRYVRIEPRDVWLMTWTNLDEMNDPEAELVELIGYLGRIAESFGPPAPEGEEDEEPEADDDDEDDEDVGEDEEASK